MIFTHRLHILHMRTNLCCRFSSIWEVSPKMIMSPMMMILWFGSKFTLQTSVMVDLDQTSPLENCFAKVKYNRHQLIAPSSTTAKHIILLKNQRHCTTFIDFASFYFFLHYFQHFPQCPCKAILSSVKISRLNAKQCRCFYFRGILRYLWMF